MLKIGVLGILLLLKGLMYQNIEPSCVRISRHNR